MTSAESQTSEASSSRRSISTSLETTMLPHSASGFISAPSRTYQKPSSTGSSRKGKGRAHEMDVGGCEVEGGLDADERGISEVREASDTEGENEDDEDDEREDDYEAERERRIRENQLILANLGIQSSSGIPGTSGEAGPSTQRQRQTSPIPKKRKSAKSNSNVPIFDRSGYVVSLPPPGQTHTMACVEMPSDRKLKRRINEGEYTDCSYWKDGEERRWRFGYGKGGGLEEGEQEYVGGVGKDFRWGKWKGLEKELRREMRLRGDLVERDARPEGQPPNPEGVSAYSLIPGEACHQCRRKSDKRKMKCRNVNPVCKATFCETCCKRYSYFDFDEDSRSFICPLCKDCCNCSNCIRKRNLAYLLEGHNGGIRRKSVKNQMDGQGGGEMTVQTWLERAVKDNIGAPFDCVRLVDQAYDIISPDLPPEEEEAAKLVEAASGQKRRGKGKKRRAQDPEEDVEGKEKNAGKEQKEKKLRKEADGADGADQDKSKAKRGRPKKAVGKLPIPDTNPSTTEKGEPEPGSNLKIKLKIPKISDLSTIQSTERVKEVDSDGDTVGDWFSNGDSSALTPLSHDSAPLRAVPPRFAFPYRPVTSQSQGHDTRSIPPIISNTIAILPVPALDRETDVPSGVGQGTRASHDLHKRPSPSRSSPGSEADDQTGPKKRKKPPPKAKIVRAPRQSSLSGPTPSPSKPTHELPLNTRNDVDASKTSTGPDHTYSIHPPLVFSTTPEGQPPDEPYFPRIDQIHQQRRLEAIAPMQTYSYSDDKLRVSDSGIEMELEFGRGQGQAMRKTIWRPRASIPSNEFGHDPLQGPESHASMPMRHIHSGGPDLVDYTSSPPYLNAFASSTHSYSHASRSHMITPGPHLDHRYGQGAAQKVGDSLQRNLDYSRSGMIEHLGPPPYSHSPAKRSLILHHDHDQEQDQEQDQAQHPGSTNSAWSDGYPNVPYNKLGTAAPPITLGLGLGVRPDIDVLPSGARYDFDNSEPVGPTNTNTNPNPNPSRSDVLPTAVGIEARFSRANGHEHDDRFYPR